ncbi:MAG: hypothetical protein AB2766_11410 [Candidatus Thiodiazotropha endolucinida]
MAIDTSRKQAYFESGMLCRTLTGKYGEVLRPFIQHMESELHANAGKGDRPGWLSMTKDQAMLEIYYHTAKLQKAVKDNDIDLIREYSADVANMSMMMLDVCGGLGD